MNAMSNNDLFGEILTIKQAATRVNLGESTVRRLAKDSKSALKIGRSYRIDINKLVDYIKTIYQVEA